MPRRKSKSTAAPADLTVTFIESVPKVRRLSARPSKYVPILEALVEKPGNTALLAEGMTKGQLSSRISSLKLATKASKAKGTFSFRQRHTAPGVFSLFATYTK